MADNLFKNSDPACNVTPVPVVDFTFVEDCAIEPSPPPIFECVRPPVPNEPCIVCPEFTSTGGTINVGYSGPGAACPASPRVLVAVTKTNDDPCQYDFQLDLDIPIPRVPCPVINVTSFEVGSSYNSEGCGGDNTFTVTPRHRPPTDCNDPGECEFDIDLEIFVPIPRAPCPVINVTSFEVGSSYNSEGCGGDNTFTVTPRHREPVDCNDPGECEFDIDLAITVPIPRAPCPVINVKQFSVQANSGSVEDPACCYVIDKFVTTIAARNALPANELWPKIIVRTTETNQDWVNNGTADNPFWSLIRCESTFTVTPRHRPPTDCNDPGECEFDIELDINFPVPIVCPKIRTVNFNVGTHLVRKDDEQNCCQSYRADATVDSFLDVAALGSQPPGAIIKVRYPNVVDTVGDVGELTEKNYAIYDRVRVGPDAAGRFRYFELILRANKRTWVESDVKEEYWQNSGTAESPSWDKLSGKVPVLNENNTLRVLDYSTMLELNGATLPDDVIVITENPNVNIFSTSLDELRLSQGQPEAGVVAVVKAANAPASTGRYYVASPNAQGGWEPYVPKPQDARYFRARSKDVRPLWAQIFPMLAPPGPDVDLNAGCENVFKITPSVTPGDCGTPPQCEFDVELSIQVPIPTPPCPVINVKNFAARAVINNDDCCTFTTVPDIPARNALTLEEVPVGGYAKTDTPDQFWRRQSESAWAESNNPCSSSFNVTSKHRPPVDCNDPGECEFDIDLNIAVPIPSVPCPKISSTPPTTFIGYADTPCVECSADETVGSLYDLSSIPADKLKNGLFVSVTNAATIYTLSGGGTWTPAKFGREVRSFAELDAIPLSERANITVTLANPPMLYRRLGDAWEPIYAPEIDFTVQSAAERDALSTATAPPDSVVKIAAAPPVYYRRVFMSGWSVVLDPGSEAPATEVSSIEARNNLPTTVAPVGSLVLVAPPATYWRRAENGNWVSENYPDTELVVDNYDKLADIEAPQPGTIVKLKSSPDKFEYKNGTLSPAEDADIDLVVHDETALNNLPLEARKAGMRVKIANPTDRYRFDGGQWVPARCPKNKFSVNQTTIPGDCTKHAECSFDLALDLVIPIPKPTCPNISVTGFSTTTIFADKTPNESCADCNNDIEAETYEAAVALLGAAEIAAGTTAGITKPKNRYKLNNDLTTWTLLDNVEPVTVTNPDNLSTLSGLVVGQKVTVENPDTLYRLGANLKDWTPVRDGRVPPPSKVIVVNNAAALATVPASRRFSGLYAKILNPVTQYTVGADSKLQPTGGDYTVDTVADLDQIPSNERTAGMIVTVANPLNRLRKTESGAIVPAPCPKNQFTIRKRTKKSDDCNTPDQCDFEVDLDILVPIPRVPCPIISVKNFKVDTRFTGGNNDDACCLNASSVNVTAVADAAARNSILVETVPIGGYVKTTDDDKFWLRTGAAANAESWEETDNPNGSTCKNRFTVKTRHKEPENCEDPGQCEFDIDLQIDVPIPRIPCPIINSTFNLVVGYEGDACFDCVAEFEVATVADLAAIPEEDIVEGMRVRITNPAAAVDRYRREGDQWLPAACSSSRFEVTPRHVPGDDCKDPGQCEFDIALDLQIPIPKPPCPEINTKPPNIRVVDSACLQQEDAKPPSRTVATVCDLYDITNAANGDRVLVTANGVVYKFVSGSWQPQITTSKFTVTTRHESNTVTATVNSIAERDALDSNPGDVVAVTGDPTTYWRRGDCTNGPKWSQIAIDENTCGAPPKCVFDLALDILVPLPPNPCPVFNTAVSASAVYAGRTDDCCSADRRLTSLIELIALGPIGTGTPLQSTVGPPDGTTAFVTSNKTRWRFLRAQGGWRPAACGSYFAIIPRPGNDDCEEEEKKCEFDVILDVVVTLPSNPCPVFTTSVSAGAFYGTADAPCSPCASTFSFDTLTQLTALGQIGNGQPLSSSQAAAGPPEGTTASVKQNNTRWRWVAREGGWRPATCGSYFTITPAPTTDDCEAANCQFDVVLDIAVPVPLPPCPVFNTRTNSVTFCPPDQYPRSHVSITKRPQTACGPNANNNDPASCIFDFDFVLQLPCPRITGGIINVNIGSPYESGGFITITPNCDPVSPDAANICPSPAYAAADIAQRDQIVNNAASAGTPIAAGTIFKVQQPLPNGSYWEYLGGGAWAPFLCDNPDPKPTCGFDFSADITVPYCEPTFREDDPDGFHTGIPLSERYVIYYVKPEQVLPLLPRVEVVIAPERSRVTGLPIPCKYRHATITTVIINQVDHIADCTKYYGDPCCDTGCNCDVPACCDTEAKILFDDGSAVYGASESENFTAKPTAGGAQVPDLTGEVIPARRPIMRNTASGSNGSCIAEAQGIIGCTSAVYGPAEDAGYRPFKFLELNIEEVYSSDLKTPPSVYYNIDTAINCLRGGTVRVKRHGSEAEGLRAQPSVTPASETQPVNNPVMLTADSAYTPGETQPIDNPTLAAVAGPSEDLMPTPDDLGTGRVIIEQNRVNVLIELYTNNCPPPTSEFKALNSTTELSPALLESFIHAINTNPALKAAIRQVVNQPD